VQVMGSGLNCRPASRSWWWEVGGDDRVEVIVVGAGQAGLAIDFFLTRQGCRFLILEAADAVGAAEPV
jgi:ribulose 1,5-bisphosphate synthetase/thiazole synthase